MFQQDLYNGKIILQIINSNHSFLEETIPKTSDNNLDTRHSLLISESEFVKISPSSSIERTPSPDHLESNQTTERTSRNNYSAYDSRPIKPLDQNMLQSKLNQYPIDDINISQTKRTSTHVAYNANRYSPKTTTRGPTASAAMHTKPNRNSTKHQTKQRHTIPAKPIISNEQKTGKLTSKDLFNHSICL
jgi:hypothetical protein